MRPAPSPSHPTKEIADPVRIAVVGLGYWGPNIVRNLNDLPSAAVDTVCDGQPEAVAQLATRYPGLKTSTDFNSILADEAIEAVAIATSVRTHAELATAALEAGKHVFVEKPLAASSVEAEALTILAKERNRVLMPGHTFLYSPPVNVIRELIRLGELGQIYFISSSRVNLGIHRSDVSVIWDLAPHDFSIMLYWLQEIPESISAVSRSCVIPNIADVAFINLQFPSGTLAHVELSWLAPSKLRRTAVVGSEKMVVYDDSSAEPVRLFDSGVVLPEPQTFGEYRLTYRTGDIVSPRVDAVEPLALELTDFCDAIRGLGEPRATPGLGVDVVRMIEAAERSLESGGARVEALHQG